jgi:signal transduction histidine kinase
VAYIPSIIIAVQQELWIVAFIDTISYPVVIWVFAAKKKSLKLRAGVMVIYLFFLSEVLIVSLGMIGAGYLWLFAVPLMAAVIADTKLASIMLGLNFITLIAVGFLINYQIIPIYGETIYSLASWTVVSGNFIFLNVIVTVMVILSIKGLEKTLNNERLIYQELQEKNNELITAKEKAEKSDRLKSEFLAQMSHEIRTPINVLLNFVMLMKDETEHLSEDVKEFLPSVDSAGRRIVRTTDQILNMAEIQADTYEPRFSRTDLVEDIIKNEFFDYQSEAKAKELIYDLNVLTDDPAVILDSHGVTSIFSNLIDNAIKYTPPKGSVKVNVNRDGNGHLYFEVSDTGIGISEEYIERIFDHFSQEEQGYTRKFDGTGLGMTLVKKYCEMNKAELDIKSVKDKGTTIRVTFNGESVLK